MSTSDHPPDSERSRTRNRRLEEIFNAALDVAPEERAVFLDRACAGDDELRREVENLLEVERAQTLGPLPSRELAIDLAVADLHPSLKGLSLAPGVQIGRYELLRPLGQGGMGTVFLAHDTRLHRRVAIKFLHAATSEMTARFIAEARTTARCKHENIVVIHDVDEIDGRPYMVLEHLEGEPLRQRLAGLIGGSDTASATPAARRREAPAIAPAMPVASVLEFIIPVVRALVCAHEHGIVHRDLKPENVFLCGNGTVKVLDFGIAKVLTDAHGLGFSTTNPAAFVSTMRPQERVVTEQGALLGTLPYMSPEQWGADEIDERTDVWAVGIMLYEMVAGRHPLAPLSYNKIQQQIPDLDLSMPSVELAIPDLGVLAEVIDGCLRKRKAERLRSADALLQALEDVHRGQFDSPGVSPRHVIASRVSAADAASGQIIPNEQTREAALSSLLTEIFDGDGAGLLRWVHLHLGEAIHDELPTSVPLSRLALDTALAIQRHGLAEQAFASLLDERPGQAGHIQQVAMLCDVQLDSGAVHEPAIPDSKTAMAHASLHVSSAECVQQSARTASPSATEESDPEPSGGRESVSETSLQVPTRSRSRRLARTGVGMGLSILVLLALWPRISLPQFPGTSGGIVLTVRAGADEELLQTYRALCTALRALDTQAVRCVELPRFGIYDGVLLEVAAAAHASLVAQFEGDHDLRLLPVGATAELLSELPTIHAAASETQRHLPGVLHPLSRMLADDLRFDELRAPSVSSNTVGWRLATLAWYLNVLARNPRVIPPADVRRTMAHCRETVSLADVSCALAHYVHTQLEPTPLDARQWLEELLAHGPRDFKELVAVELAEDDCMHEPERAQTTLLRLAARWADDPCRRVTLVGAATCLLTRRPDSHPALRRIAYPEEDKDFTDLMNDKEFERRAKRKDFAGCGSTFHSATFLHPPDRAPSLPPPDGAPSLPPPDGAPSLPPPDGAPSLPSSLCGTQLFAVAWAERGQWNMRARNWKQAADDFFRAWEKGNHPIDLLRWAESLLHQRNSSADAERQVAEGLDLRYFEGNDELRHLAAFLRWLATHREVDAAKVLHSYSVTPVHSSVIMDDERTLAVLACAKPEYAECRVYRILTQPKQSEAEEELRRLLSQLTSTGD